MKGKQSKAEQGQQDAGMFPLSGKERPDAVDIHTLQRDRKSLAGIFAALLKDRWLMGLLVHEYCERNGLYVVPKDWMDAQLDARLAILEALDPVKAGRIKKSLRAGQPARV